VIVVDTNILAAFCLVGDKNVIAQNLWATESIWHAPALWVSEFRNVLCLYQRRGIANAETCTEVMRQARMILPPTRTHHPDDDFVLELAFQSGCTAYDCEFVAVAKFLNAKLVTWDEALIRSFPEAALTPENFLTPTP